MTLYEVDLDKIAVPVKSVQKRKREPKPAKEPKEVKEKKPRSKKPKVDEVAVELEKVLEEIEAPTVEAPAAVEEKVEVKVEEKVEPKVEKKEKKPRAPRVKKEDTEPPQWFARYVEGVKKEQATLKAEKIPAKKIREEANVAATKSWNNGLTRNRVQNEVDSHSKLKLI